MKPIKKCRIITPATIYIVKFESPLMIIFLQIYNLTMRQLVTNVTNEKLLYFFNSILFCY